MKKLLFTLIVGLSFVGFGISTASASTFQDGMLLASNAKCGAGKCGGDKKAKCGEGKCGGEKKATKCGEGKCGGDKKAKCGEGKCGGDKPKKTKGACGVGKCG